MPVLSVEDTIVAALEDLPIVGTEMPFDDYKAKLQQKYPDNWKESFQRMLKNNMLKTTTRRPAPGQIAVFVSRK